MLVRTVQVFVIAALSMLALHVHAQDGTRHRYLFTLAQPLDEEHEKLLSEVLVAWDPSAAFHTTNGSNEVDMTTSILTEKGALQAHFWSQDLVIVDWDAEVPIHASVRTPLGVPGAPKYFDTGDPRADDERYEQAKAAWIEAHGDQYERLLKHVE